MSGNHSRFKLIFLTLFQLFIGHDGRITPSDQLKKAQKSKINLPNLFFHCYLVIAN